MNAAANMIISNWKNNNLYITRQSQVEPLNSADNVLRPWVLNLREFVDDVVENKTYF